MFCWRLQRPSGLHISAKPIRAKRTTIKLQIQKPSPIQKILRYTKTPVFKDMSHRFERHASRKKASQKGFDGHRETQQSQAVTGTCESGTRNLRSETVSDCQRCVSQYQRRFLGPRYGDCMWLAQPQCPTTDRTFENLAKFLFRINSSETSSQTDES